MAVDFTGDSIIVEGIQCDERHYQKRKMMNKEVKNRSI